MPDAIELSQYIAVQKAIFSSLRLKEVTDNSVAELTKITDGAAIALFLTDNQCQSFRLLAFAAYSQPSLSEMQLLPFTAPSLLSVVKDKLEATSLTGAGTELTISSSIMQREASQLQLGLPLIASNILVGALLLDFKNSVEPQKVHFLGYIAQTIAIAIANSILFGRSEYERERFCSLHRCISLLNGGSLNSQALFQTVIDTASFLANTPNCALLLYEGEKDLFTLAASKGLAEDSLSQFNLNGTGTVAGSTLKLRKTEYVTDSSQTAGLPRAAAGGAIFNSLLALPLVYGERPLGILYLFSTELQAFKDDQVYLLENLKSETDRALNALLETSLDLLPTYNGDAGLYSRGQFDQLLKRELVKQNGEAGLLLVGIDDFNVIDGRLSKIDDSEISHQVAKIIKDVVRDQDKVCAFSNKQFVVLLPETSHESVLQIAERVNAKVRKSKISSASIGEITVSIGVAAYPLHANDAAGLLQSCEQALLVAKYQGQDKVLEPHSSKMMGQSSTNWLALVEQAKLAFANKERFENKAQLTPAPDYAVWLTKDPVLVEGEASEK
jgi:diguanylate cyclase (GGDEF)-like protein